MVDNRCKDLLIAVLLVDASPEVEHSIVKLEASWKPVRHTRRCLVEHKELLLRSDLLVIALHSLLDECKMVLKSILIRKYVYVDSLKLISVLITSPVCAGNRLDLECSIHKILRVVYVRSAAEIYEIITCVIQCEECILRKILDKLCLKLLILKYLKCLGTSDLNTLKVLTALDDLTHLVLDGLVVILCYCSRKNEIIIHSVIDLRSDGILYIFLSEDLNNCFC